MKKAKSPSFVHSFEILPAKDEGFKNLFKTEDHGRRLYNAVLGKLRSRLKRVKSSKAWADARLIPKGSKARGLAFRTILEAEELTEYGAYDLATLLAKGSPDFKLWLGSHVIQKIGKRAYQAIERLMHGKAKRIRFKRRNDSFSFEGQNNATFLRFLFDDEGRPYVRLGKIDYSVRYNADNHYDSHALGSRVKYVRIIQKRIKKKFRIFAQLVLEGLPYQDLAKKVKHEEKLKLHFGEALQTKLDNTWDDVVSIDYGPSKIAIATARVAYEVNLRAPFEKLSQKAKASQRAMSRSLRLGNPEAFKDGGKLKKGVKLKRSKNYEKLRLIHAEEERKVSETRKSFQGNLSNEILCLGTTIKIENISYRAMQRNFGKSIGKAAPASLKGILSRKASALGGSEELINTYDTKLSQTCICGAMKKKSLSERWHSCPCGFSMQRDELSARLGVFTINSQVVAGRKKKISSRIDMKAARLHIVSEGTFAKVEQALANGQGLSDGLSPEGGAAKPLETSIKNPIRKDLEPIGIHARWEAVFS
ncbi:MAG: hypothetical protein EOP04_02045 [Proteobacteria bacterium]|nr:MAG: hypothetical protein EOP04_02045 [Pseudomonadota bacterium]